MTTLLLTEVIFHHDGTKGGSPWPSDELEPIYQEVVKKCDLDCIPALLDKTEKGVLVVWDNVKFAHREFGDEDHTELIFDETLALPVRESLDEIQFMLTASKKERR